MVVGVEKRKVIMTADGKCILRASSDHRYLLCRVSEKSRTKIRLYSSLGDTRKFCENLGIRISDEVAELYNVPGVRFYDNIRFPDLIGVVVDCTYEVK